MATVHVASGGIFQVEDRGRSDAAPLLLLHGFTGSSEAWGEDLLHGLAARRRVLVPDLPGHGDSPLPRPGGLALPALVDDLCSLLDRCEVERAVWVGYSMGGRVALGAGVLRPDRVERLVLESASPGILSEVERAERRALEAEWARTLEVDGIESFVEYWSALPLFSSQQELPKEIRAREKGRRLRGSREGWLRALRELGTGRQPSFWEHLQDLTMPVLLLTGERDSKFVALADRMSRRLPDAVHRTVPGVGHTVHLEAPEIWSDAVLGFVGGSEEGSSRALKRPPM